MSYEPPIDARHNGHLASSAAKYIRSDYLIRAKGCWLIQAHDYAVMYRAPTQKGIPSPRIQGGFSCCPAFR